MKKLLFFAILFSTSLVYAQLPQVPQKAWQQLFNGKDLTGWSVKIRGYDYNAGNFGEVRLS